MDPLSITAGVASVSATLAKATNVIDTVFQKLKTAPLVLTSIQSEISLTLRALERIQRAYTTKRGKLANNRLSLIEQLEELDYALTGCVKTISFIDDEFQRIDQKTTTKDRSFAVIRWAGNLHYLQNEKSLQSLAQLLSRQNTALQLLLQTQESESLSTIQESQRNVTILLQSINEEFNHMRKRYRRVSVPESILNGAKTSDFRKSIAADDDVSFVSLVEKSIDEQCMDSAAYRQAFAKFERVIALNESRSHSIGQNSLDVDARPQEEEDLQQPEHDDMQSGWPRSERSSTPQSPKNVVEKSLEGDSAVPRHNPPYVSNSISKNDQRMRYVPKWVRWSLKAQGGGPVNIDQAAVKATMDARLTLTESERRSLDYRFFRLFLRGVPDHNEVILLLTKGADVNVHGPSLGLSDRKAKSLGYVLALACDSDANFYLVRLLLSRCANVNARGSDYTPLIQACESTANGIIDILLQAGADPSLSSGYYHPAEMLCRKDDLDNILKLISHGLDVNKEYASWPNTALIAAAACGRNKIIQALLEHGALVNHGSRITALSEAVKNYSDENNGGSTIRLLLENGADPNSTAERESVWKVAAKLANEGAAREVFEILEEYHPRPNNISPPVETYGAMTVIIAVLACLYVIYKAKDYFS